MTTVDEYLHAHRAAIEAAIASMLAATVEARAEQPLRFMAQHLQRLAESEAAPAVDQPSLPVIKDASTSVPHPAITSAARPFCRGFTAPASLTVHPASRSDVSVRNESAHTQQPRQGPVAMFPMHVMRVHDFLQLDELKPYGDLLALGLVFPLPSDDTETPVNFVSQCPPREIRIHRRGPASAAIATIQPHKCW